MGMFEPKKQIHRYCLSVYLAYIDRKMSDFVYKKRMGVFVDVVQARLVMVWCVCAHTCDWPQLVS